MEREAPPLVSWNAGLLPLGPIPTACTSTESSLGPIVYHRVVTGRDPSFTTGFSRDGDPYFATWLSWEETGPQNNRLAD